MGQTALTSTGSAFEDMGLALPEAAPKAAVVVPQAQSPLPQNPSRTKLSPGSAFDDINFSKPAGLTKDEVLASPERMTKIRNMLVESKDTYYQTAPDEEVFNTFMTHMRYLNTNEGFVAWEAAKNLVASEETKAVHGNAYMVYEELGGITENGTGKARMVSDYAGAILSSPSLYIGAVIGKIAGMGTTKAATVALVKGATTAAKAAAKTATTKASSKTIVEMSTLVAKEAAKKGATKAQTRTILETVANIAIKTNVKKATLAAFAIEAPTATLADYMYQDIMMDTGVQGEFNYMQSALSTVLGGLGAATSFASAGPLRGVSGLSDAGAKIEAGKVARTKGANKRVISDLKKSIIKANTDWIKLVKEGRSLGADRELDEAVVKWFFDYKSEDGFGAILQRSGVFVRGEDDLSFSHSLVKYAKGLDVKERLGLDEAFAPLGIKFSQVTAVFADTMRKGGVDLSMASAMSKFLGDYKNITVSNTAAARGVLDELGKEVKEVVPNKQTLGYIQSKWKGALVAALSTTLVNIKGWGMALSGRSLADVVQVGGLLGVAGVQALMGKSTDVSLGQANHLLKNLRYMTKMAVDPFTVTEAFYKTVEQMPKKKQKEIARQFFQGTEKQGAASFGMDEGKWWVKGMEHYVDIAQRISLVNFQDVMTKSFSGIKELDKQSRLVLGVGYEELLNKGRLHEITDEMYDKVIAALQEDTFSLDYRGSKTWFGQMAELSQRVSSTPGFGFIYPFGQFINNMMDFTTRFSPLAFVGIGIKVWPSVTGKSALKAGEGMDLGHKASQAIVGSLAIAHLYSQAKEDRDQGLQWNEVREDTGEVSDIGNVFPYGFYKLIGRFVLGVFEGEGVNRDLVTALSKQLTFPQALSSAGDPQIIGDMVQYLLDERNSEEDRGLVMGGITSAIEAISAVAAPLANIAAGFTRPFATLNDAVGIASDVDGYTSNVTVDRKQSEGLDLVIQNLTRYTDTLFNFLLGEEGEDGKKLYGEPKFSATQKGPVASGNPVAALFGRPVAQRRTAIDRLLGMVDKAPFKADSFTSGIPEWDAFLNENINRVLERVATNTMNSPTFKNLSKAGQIGFVNKVLKDAKNEVIASLEGGRIGGSDKRRLLALSRLTTRPRSEIISAKEHLGITIPNKDLSVTQIEMIVNRMQMTEDMLKTLRKRM